MTSEERTFSTVNRELGRLAGLNRMLVWGDSLKALAAGQVDAVTAPLEQERVPSGVDLADRPRQGVDPGMGG